MTHDEQLIDVASQKREATAATFTSQGVQYHYRVPLSERLSVWLKNIPAWPTALAVWYLSRQLQRDKAFRDAWHANIAMPIYDATRSTETLDKQDCGWRSHMEGTQANHIADRLLQHLFGA